MIHTHFLYLYYLVLHFSFVNLLIIYYNVRLHL